MVSSNHRFGITADSVRVDPKDFAHQVDYLARLGRMVVPRAYAFAGRKILFVGDEPFSVEELGNLLPDGVTWYKHESAPEDYTADILVLGRALPKGLVRSVLNGTKGSPKIIPQEGFLDELLFGHDWWDVKRESLDALINGHKGLQAARSFGALRVIGIGAPPPAEKKSAGTNPQLSSPKPVGAKGFQADSSAPSSTFAWPSTDAEESGNTTNAELDLRPESRLRQLGYHTEKPRSARWRVLTNNAVPEMGLPRVAGLIAWFCRSRKQQKGGRQKYVRAIGEWEHDLARLKKEVYPHYKPKFAWPRIEP